MKWNNIDKMSGIVLTQADTGVPPTFVPSPLLSLWQQQEERQQEQEQHLGVMLSAQSVTGSVPGLWSQAAAFESTVFPLVAK